VGPDDALFPYPGTDRLWTESEYRNWREAYFVPIARSHGLGSESDDPYVAPPHLRDIAHRRAPSNALHRKLDGHGGLSARSMAASSGATRAGVH
jgi:hypothetical protein